jgi:hypothetical protein
MDSSILGSLFSPVSDLVFWSYSPNLLRQLRQPVPQDAPDHVNANIFTFEDAFEDLLAVSQGRGLPDIIMKHDQRKLLRQMWPHGEPFEFWHQRLQSQGLLTHFQAFSRDVPWWMRDELEEDREDRDDERHDHSWNRLLEDLGLTPRESKRNHPEDEYANGESKPDSRRQPSHFEELFDALDSTATAKHDQPKQSNAAPGTKQVATREEHVDGFGYLHSKVTVKTLDANGNEIGSQMHYTMQRAPKEHVDSSKAGQEELSEYDADRPVKKAGWFWK